MLFPRDHPPCPSNTIGIVRGLSQMRIRREPTAKAKYLISTDTNNHVKCADLTCRSPRGAPLARVHRLAVNGIALLRSVKGDTMFRAHVESFGGETHSV